MDASREDEQQPPETGAEAAARAHEKHRERSAAMRRRRFSPLTARILALNILPLATIFAGLMYVSGYEDRLIQSEMNALGTQARVFAGALGESAVGGETQPEQFLRNVMARQMVRRLVAPTDLRARVFDIEGRLVVDSRTLTAEGRIRVEELDDGGSWFRRSLVYAYDRFFYLLAQARDRRPLYQEHRDQQAADYQEASAALRGEAGGMIRRAEEGYLVMTYAAPVQRYRRVVGAVMLSTTSIDIDIAVRRVRLQILGVFSVVMFVTVVLSFYLARAIARPINQLAAGAYTMQRGENRLRSIPDLSDRDDEIGDLSLALRDLTEELWRRFDAIERFAADVAHELKNPLSSLRSAVETAARIKDDKQRAQLMAVIQEDVQRLDRLITDISRASRLDSELARIEPEPVDLPALLGTVAELQGGIIPRGGPRLVVDIDADEALTVLAVEDRLVQVLQNLIANAVSFSPENGTIRIAAERDGDMAAILVEDQGPGIAPGKEEAIFDRFYTERPEGEKFGTHSGLGLSISRQIVEALDGSLTAENIVEDGEVRGARLIVRLPLYRE